MKKIIFVITSVIAMQFFVCSSYGEDLVEIAIGDTIHIADTVQLAFNPRSIVFVEGFGSIPDYVSAINDSVRVDENNLAFIYFSLTLNEGAQEGESYNKDISYIFKNNTQEEKVDFSFSVRTPSLIAADTIEIQPGEEHEFDYSTYTNFCPSSISVDYNGEGESFFTKTGTPFVSCFLIGSQYLSWAKFKYLASNDVPVGEYEGELTIIFSNGINKDTLTKIIVWKVVEGKINAKFSATPTEGEAPLTVQFSDISTGNATSWLWDFGDGNTSTEQNPEHIYSVDGNYSVTLIVSKESESDTLTKTNYINVSAPIPPEADFSATPTEGKAPLTVQFTDNSTGNITSWLWDFGDGNTSTEQNPSHIYDVPSEYTVSLVVGNEYSSDTLKKQNYILVSIPSTIADFSFDIIKDTVPVTINFKDSSTGIITSWFWDFGDGNTSTEQNPSHIYQNPAEFYKVSLKVSSNYDKDSIQKNVSGGVLWKNLVSGQLSECPALARDGTIYLGTGNTKALLAINPDGTIKWKFDSINNSVGSSPSVDKNGTVYVCGLDSCLYAINPGGTLKWKFKFNHSDRCSKSPAIGKDGTIYVGGYSNYGYNECYLYAINSEGTLKWKYRFDFEDGSEIGTPTLAKDGTIYIGNDIHFYAFNSDGTIKWEKVNFYARSSNPAISLDGTVYVNSKNELVAYNPNGTVKWVYSVEDIMRSPVLGEDGTIYFGTFNIANWNGNLVALNPDGTLKWKTFVGGNISDSPTISINGTIYIVGGNINANPRNHFLSAFDNNGIQKWKFEGSYTNGVSTPPVINNNGTLYFGFESYFYSIPTNNGGLAESSWPCFQGNSFNTGSTEENLNSINLEILANNLICYPNPFSEQISIQFEIEKTENINLEIFDIHGRKVTTLISEKLSTGKHEVIWNGTNQSANKLSSGLLLVKLTSNNKIQTNKILLE